VVFLDEPTAGVDPEGRLEIRRVIAGLRDRGVCVLLTTHELPEAERLADEVVIISGGRAVAQGTVAELAAAGGEAGIRFNAPAGLDLEALALALGAGSGAVAERQPGEYTAEVSATPARVAALATWLADRDLPMSDLRAGTRSLEEAYLAAMREAKTTASEERA
jgi:ABC-2 type transport system ATP-binding protein